MRQSGEVVGLVAAQKEFPSHVEVGQLAGGQARQVGEMVNLQYRLGYYWLFIDRQIMILYTELRDALQRGWPIKSHSCYTRQIAYCDPQIRSKLCIVIPKFAANCVLRSANTRRIANSNPQIRNSLIILKVFFWMVLIPSRIAIPKFAISKVFNKIGGFASC